RVSGDEMARYTAESGKAGGTDDDVDNEDAEATRKCTAKRRKTNKTGHDVNEENSEPPRKQRKSYEANIVLGDAMAEPTGRQRKQEANPSIEL
ncbi:MAG: hypothetical protein Q9181_008100, partial [Wetmoreana brouardii]